MLTTIFYSRSSQSFLNYFPVRTYVWYFQLQMSLFLKSSVVAVLEMIRFVWLEWCSIIIVLISRSTFLAVVLLSGPRLLWDESVWNVRISYQHIESIHPRQCNQSNNNTTGASNNDLLTISESTEILKHPLMSMKLNWLFVSIHLWINKISFKKTAINSMTDPIIKWRGRPQTPIPTHLAPKKWNRHTPQ